MRYTDPCTAPSSRRLRRLFVFLLLGFSLPWALVSPHAFAQNDNPSGVLGYYSHPTMHGNQIVFVAGGDLWSTTLQGGIARRLTSHKGPELYPRFSPDGKWIAFSAMFDGDQDVYIMPAKGGQTRRLTFRGGPDQVVGWTPDGKHVVFRTLRKYYLWNTYLYKVPVTGTGQATRVRVGYASSIAYSPDGKQAVFNRDNRDRRTWKRYTGGWAQDLWIGSLTQRNYRKLTKFPGTDAFPMWHKQRIYFLSDRTGVRNIYSIQPDGKQLWQHTFSKSWDVRWPSLGTQHIVYQLGADLQTLNLSNNKTKTLPIRLADNALRRRNRFVNPLINMAGFDLGPKGQRLLITARGELFNVPVKEGVSIRVTRSSKSHEKFATFSMDGKHIIAMSDNSGEEEVTLFDPLGEKPPKAVTRKSNAWNFWPVESPNGKHIAYSDKNLVLWIVDKKTGAKTKVVQSKVWEIYTYSWSPDSRYLAYVDSEPNRFRSIFIYDTKKKENFRATRQWTDDSSPTWSADGKHLFFVSRREINPTLGSFDFTELVTKAQKVYAIVLSAKNSDPFAPKDTQVQQRNNEEKKAAKKAKKEAKASKTSKQTIAKSVPSKDKTPTKAIQPRPMKKKDLAPNLRKVTPPPTTAPSKAGLAKSLQAAKPKTKLDPKQIQTAKPKVVPTTQKAQPSKAKETQGKSNQIAKKKKGKKPCKCQKGKPCKCKAKKVVVKITRQGLLDRVFALPKIPAGNYTGLTATSDRLLLMTYPTFKLTSRRSRKPQLHLWAYLFKAKKLMPIARNIQGYSSSSNKKFLALRRGLQFRVMSAKAAREPKGRKGLVKLNGIYRVKINPVQEWKQIFAESIRLQRDFFWSPTFGGLDWKGIGKRYMTLLDRLLTRDDLNDLIGENIAELGTSHTYVGGGDRQRYGRMLNGLLGADLIPDKASGFYRFQRILRGAPWAQQVASPLVSHQKHVRKGTYLLAIDGQPLKASDSYYKRLEGKGNQLVTLTINNKPTLKGSQRIVIKAIHWYQDRQLRYIEWVEGRRRETDRLSKGKVAYIHLPNMSTAGMVAFYRMWYAQLHKRAMVIDVRGNGGGFVSQLLLQKIMRKIWAFFKPRNTNLNNTVPSRTFHGHVAVVTNQNAASDGDIFCQSFQLLKLGPVFGTRTWGGVVGIRSNKRFVDGGLTTQPEYAWWSPSLGWKLENSGIQPDYRVDNTPTDMERNQDRQLEETVDWLLAQLKKDPKTLPKLPPYPSKTIKSFRERWKQWQAKPAPGTQAGLK